MKATINGKRYDTDKAMLLGKSRDGARNNLYWWKAGLYRTPRSGDFFLAGEGGPMSWWGRRTDEGCIAGSGIVPLTRDDARSWAKACLNKRLEDA